MVSQPQHMQAEAAHNLKARHTIETAHTHTYSMYSINALDYLIIEGFLLKFQPCLSSLLYTLK